MCCTWLDGNTGRKNDAKNRHLRTVAQLCRAISSQLRSVGLSTIGKNLLNSNTSSTCSHNMVNFGPLTAEPEIGSGVWGTPANFNGFCVLARDCSSGRQPNCGVEQRASPTFGRTAITLGIVPHSSCFSFFITLSSFGSVQKIKLAIRQLLGARNYSALYHIVS